MTEKTNAKKFPSIFYCRHMLPGIAGYHNENILIDADAMKRAAPTFIGKPVFVHHQKVELNTLEHDADGWVTDCFYNELDGWLWAKFIVISDEAQTAVSNRWSVSNAYEPKSWSEAGQHLNIDYDRKMRDYAFTHLAIVPNPRYEEAQIFSPDEFKAYQAAKRGELEELQNSKPLKGHPMFKLFQKKTEEITNNIPADADLSQVEMEVEGKRVSLQEIINAVKKNEEDEAAAAKKAEEEKEKENVLNEDTEVTVGDEKMPLKTLMNKYNAIAKKNAEEEEEIEKTNAKAAAAKKAEDEKAAERMRELTNAHNKKPVTASIEISQDKVARGKARYGSAKK